MKLHYFLLSAMYCEWNQNYWVHAFLIPQIYINIPHILTLQRLASYESTTFFSKGVQQVPPQSISSTVFKCKGKIFRFKCNVLM
jgi:hypothetical protein